MIDTERKEDLFLDTKLIKSENKLGKLRIIDELHPVLGGQPTHEKDQPNDNNPFLDLACTMQFTIDKVNAVDKKADTKLAKAQNLKDVANVSIARDNLGLGTSATMNATSTLSDRTDQTATIKAVNDVNRAASTAQKTANNAHALAQTKQDKLTFVGDGPDVMKTGAGGILSQGFDYRKLNHELTPKDFYKKGTRFGFGNGAELGLLPGLQVIMTNGHWDNGTGGPGAASMIGIGKEISYRYLLSDEQWSDLIVLYGSNNTTRDKSGFLRGSGNSDAIITTDIATKSKAGITRLDSSLSDAEDRAATPKMVNDVNRDVVTAQKTANNAHALAQSKQDKLTFVGDGPDVMKTGAGGILKSQDFRDPVEQGDKKLGLDSLSPEELIDYGTTIGFANIPGRGYASVMINAQYKDPSGLGSFNKLYIGSGWIGLKHAESKEEWSDLILLLNEKHLTSNYGQSKALAATQYLVNETAKKATNAHYRADEAYGFAENLIGKKWVDMKTQRASGVTYSNNTEKYIFVKVSTGLITRSSIKIYVDELLTEELVTTDGKDLATRNSISCFIPPKSKYRVELSNTTILHWVELR